MLNKPATEAFEGEYTRSITPQWELRFDSIFVDKKNKKVDASNSIELYNWKNPHSQQSQEVKEFIRHLLAESIREERKWIKEELDGLLRLGGISHAEGMMKGWWVNYDEVRNLITKESK
jgi:hypothetical protein